MADQDAGPPAPRAVPPPAAPLTPRATPLPPRAPNASAAAPLPPDGIRLRGRSATRRLALMVVATVLTLGGAGGLVAVQTLDHARTEAREDAAFQARLAARATDDAIALARSTVADVATGFPTEQLLAHPEQCRLRFAGVGPFTSAHLDVVTPGGRVVCSSLADTGAPQGATHAGASWVPATAAPPSAPAGAPAADQQPELSPAFDDRLTGKRAVAVTASLQDGDGRVVAVLAAVLALPPLSASLAATYGGPRGFAFAVTSDGTTLSDRAGSGAAGAGPGATGERWLGGSAAVSRVPWRVDASIPEERATRAAEAVLRKGAVLGSAVVALLVLLLLVVHRQIARPLDRLAVAEASVRESQERLQLLLHGARDYAIVMLDPAGRVVSWSAGAEWLDGYASGEVLGRDYAGFFPPDDVAAGRPEHILRAVTAAGRLEDEGVRVRRDGSHYWARTVLTAQRDPAGELQGFVAVTHDATARREAELTITRLNADLEQRVEDRTRQLELQAAQLQAANAELQSFSYSVSHDLRGPLRAISGFASILSDACTRELPQEAALYADRIVRSAESLAQMVDALLSLSATQRAAIHPEALDLTRLAGQVWDELAPERAGRRVDFVLHPLPPGHADPHLARQVLANLLENALKYSGKREHAVIEVGSRTAADGTVYYVRDNGAGFDMRHATGLFTVFQRLHHAEDFPGTGIGLASVHRIVTRHGGRIWAEGEPGRGATFFFTLAPAAAGAAGGPPAGAEPAAPAGGAPAAPEPVTTSNR